MKSILSLLFAFFLLVAVSSCTDPNADELYDLKTASTGGTGGTGGDSNIGGEAPPPPSSGD